MKGYQNTLKRVIAVASAVALMLPATPAFAETQEKSESGLADVALVGTETSSFTVGIPTSVTLSNDMENNRVKGAYTITVKGTINPNQQLTVSPAITNSVKRAGDNDEIELAIKKSDESGAPDTVFESGDLSRSVARNIDCVLVSTDKMMGSGSYSGTLTYTISLGDKP